ncbi:MAG: DUF4157 domain-containing protein [Pyrinomonadaceae bacterium]
MKKKSPKPAAKTSGKQTNVSGQGLAPPAYGINFVDRQNNSNDAPVQGVFESSPEETFSFEENDKNPTAIPSKSLPNKTGLPDNLKKGIENLSGFSMDAVRVHYNSSRPAQLNALAYTQGTEIHVAPGQERHLPHEAWHTVQQMQGRVNPTMQMKDKKVSINDDKRLENEADVMGAKALRMTRDEQSIRNNVGLTDAESSPVVQRFPIFLNEMDIVYTDSKYPWMRMIHRRDLGNNTFELLRTNGAPSASYMIHEEEYDQYRFSSDGAEIDERFAPHFMEEITGDATVDDEYEDPLYSYVGEYGVGYRPASGARARLELSGLISCIGFILESENAGFACHMVVTDGVPQSKQVLKRQVNALVRRFEQYAGERPDNCQLLYDETTYQGRPGWLSWMEPDNVRTIISPADGDYRMNITGHEDTPTVMWRAMPIRY